MEGKESEKGKDMNVDELVRVGRVGTAATDLVVVIGPPTEMTATEGVVVGRVGTASVVSGATLGREEGEEEKDQSSSHKRKKGGKRKKRRRLTGLESLYPRERRSRYRRWSFLGQEGGRKTHLV